MALDTKKTAEKLAPILVQFLRGPKELSGSDAMSKAEKEAQQNAKTLAGDLAKELIAILLDDFEITAKTDITTGSTQITKK